MQEVDINLDDFHRLFYAPNDAVYCLPMSIEKFKNIGSVRGWIIDEVADFQNEQLELGLANLPWYDSEALNLTLHNAATIFKEGNANRSIASHLNKVKKYVEDFRDVAVGLTEDIRIVSVFDSTLKARLIVDGVHRFVALKHLYLEDDTDALANLFASEWNIYLYEFESDVGGCLCPRDFMSLYFHKKTKLRPTSHD